jgi:hypothetical protein
LMMYVRMVADVCPNVAQHGGNTAGRVSWIRIGDRSAGFAALCASPTVIPGPRSAGCIGSPH